MSRYRITETVVYEFSRADDDYEAMRTFLRRPNAYLWGVAEREVLVDRGGKGRYEPADPDQIARAERDS